MVKTFICPKDVGVPDRRENDASSNHKGREFRGKTSFQEGGKTASVGPARTPFFRSAGGGSNKDQTKKARQDEVKGLMSEVKELSAKTFQGLAKKKHKDDALTHLGVDAPKQQTMPLKMALGIREGRLKRQLKTIERSKESGVVLSKNLTHKSVKEAYMGKNTGKRSREERDGLDIGTKKGVFHLKRSRLPASLVGKQ